MSIYRFTMTVTRVSEYVADAEFATREDADAYAEALMPEDMEDLDDYTTDMRVEVALVEE